jgi:calcineurin-like phosphoesterase family protein
VSGFAPLWGGPILGSFRFCYIELPAFPALSAFVTSDLHLGHAKMLSFVQPDGSPLRPFSSIEEMHETLIERFNKVVRKKDRLYILGDVAIPRQALSLLDRFNGSKVLIRGNHDKWKLKDYLPYFDDIRGAFFRDGLIYTHIPVHPANLQGGYKGNVHGHLHCHLVRTDDGQIDRRFFNACLERNDFAPVPLECIKAFFQDRGEPSADFQYAH